MSENPTLTRQARWLQRRRAQGLCVDCGNPSESYRCSPCRLKYNYKHRISTWAPGKAGRPPETPGMGDSSFSITTP